MQLKIISDGTEANTAFIALHSDGSTERIKGVLGFRYSCTSGQKPTLEVSFINVPFEISQDLQRAGGEPVGSVRYLCGCVRQYFSSKEAPKDGELCQWHGDAIHNSRNNVRPEKLVQIVGRA